MLTLLVIFGILFEVIIIGVGTYLVLKLTKSKPKSIKTGVPTIEPIIHPTKIKTNV